MAEAEIMFTENTMYKVWDVIERGITKEMSATDIINEFQNEGILFFERAK